jgi:hypothetical protein
MVTERRRKSRSRLPVDDDKESDDAQADEEHLTGSRVRLGLGERRHAAAECGSDRLAAISDRGRRGPTI